MQQQIQKPSQKNKNPQELFCHFEYTTGTCTQKRTCQFIHREKDGRAFFSGGICPNGLDCPINHRKVLCPLEKSNQICNRATRRIGKYVRKCEFSHKRRQQRPQKHQKIQQNLETIEEELIHKQYEEKEKDENIEEMGRIQEEIQEQRIQKEKLQRKFKIFQIPTLNQKNKFQRTTICGVLDGSWSMIKCYPFLVKKWNEIVEENISVKTVIFDDYAIEHKNLIPEEHNGGRTEIELGFQELNRILKQEDIHECVTVVFVSDGDDNNIHSIEQRINNMRPDIEAIKNSGKKINFLCVGVGKEFPTFLAMKIRDLYHQGEEDVPPVFLIQDMENAEEFNLQFEIMKKFLEHNKIVQVNRGVQFTPWGNYTKEVKEGSFVFGEQTIKELIATNNNINNSNGNNGSLVVKECEDFSFEDILFIGRRFLNDIQVRSLQENVNQTLLKQQALQAYDIICWLKDEYIDKGKKLSFKERVQARYRMDVLVNIIRNLKELSVCNVLSSLSQAEAAKRLAIGTRTGKYHERALQMAGISVQDFIEARDEFICILEEKLQQKSIKEESQQGESFMSLMNQKDVFFEEGFIEGLKQIPNQYDLVELFPLVGQSLFIRRTEGSMINPYLVSVQNIVRSHDTIDTVSIMQQKNEIQVSIGEGQTETINAVIPLYTEDDQDIEFFLKSKLFQILMSFNVCLNADTCIDQAYFALLCNCVLNLLNQKPSQWREDMIDKVLYTIKLVYGGKRDFLKYQEMLVQMPRLAMVFEVNLNINKYLNIQKYMWQKCEDLAKPLTHLLYLRKFRSDLINTEKIQQFYEALFQEAIGRFIPRDVSLFQQFTANLNQEFDYEKKAEEIMKYEQFEESKLVERYYTKQNLIDEIGKVVEALGDQIDIGEELKPKVIEGFMKGGKFNMMSLKNIYRYLFEENLELKFEMMVGYIVFGYNNKVSKDRFLNFEKKLSNEEAQLMIKEMKIRQLSKEIKEKLKNMLEYELVSRYEQMMVDIHDFCMPLNMKNEAACLKIQELGVLVNCKNLLPRNMCSYEKCPHFSQINKEMAQHVQSIVKIPGLYSICKEYSGWQQVSDEQVYDILQGLTLQKLNEEKKQNGGKLNFIQERTLKAITEERQVYLEKIKILRNFYSQF